MRRTQVAISFGADFIIPGLLNGEAFEKLIAGGARMGVEAARRETHPRSQPSLKTGFQTGFFTAALAYKPRLLNRASPSHFRRPMPSPLQPQSGFASNCFIAACVNV